MSLHSFFSTQKNSKRIYLDYAAATPLRKEVGKSMQPYWHMHFANPGAIHQEGLRAQSAIHEARQTIASWVKTRPQDIVFTSGGTEANNLALFGVVETLLADGRKPEEIEIISTRIEHPSILEALDRLKEQNINIQYAPITHDGRIDQDSFKTLLTPHTALITCAYVNSEIGSVEDVKGITHIVREYRKSNGGSRMPYVHIDASQAPLWLPCRMDSLGVDMMTIDAGKLYGPKGVGFLVHKSYTRLRSQTVGGDQERGVRAGTENVPLVVGCAHAFEIAQKTHEARAKKVIHVRDYFFKKLDEKLKSEFSINGSKENRVANNVHISLDGLDGEYAVISLDEAGIACSTRSACAGGAGSGSHVIQCVYNDTARAHGTIRFTLGEDTTTSEVDAAVRVVEAYIYKMRAYRSN